MLIIINNGQLKVGARSGQSLRDALAANEIKLGVCGGLGVCGRCKVKVGCCESKLTDAERKKLTEQEISDGMRLSCQVPAADGLSVEISPEMLSHKTFSAVCTKITKLTSDISMFRFDMPQGQTINYIPGQYVQLATPACLDGYPCVTRTFSISSNPADKSYFELIIRRTPNGDCTRYLFTGIRVDTELMFTGPDGDFCLSGTDSPMVFIAGGSGMSAIRCILFEMRRIKSTRKTVYFFGAPTPEGLYLLDEMKMFENELADFKFVPCVQYDPQGTWHGEKGLVTEVAARWGGDLSNAEGYLCGAPGMIDASIKVLNRIGITDDRIYYDSFG